MVSKAHLDRLFRPASIAVIGASATPGKRGYAIINELQRIGYGGAVYPIHPQNDEVLGLRCYRRLGDLPTRPDVVAVCLRSSAVPAVVEECGRAGITSLAVVSAAFADAGPEGAAIQDRMLEAAARHDVAIMGPNGLGLLNRLDRVQYWLTCPAAPEYRDVQPSGVSAVIQSGALGLSVSADCLERGLLFDYVVSAGNQASIDAADYIEWMLDDTRARTRVIGTVLEGIRKPASFRRVAAKALARGTAIIVLKPGRNAATQEFIASHTGALVGSAEVAEQVFRQDGVIAVDDLDEWIEQVVLQAHCKRPAGSRWCMVTQSGSASAIISDLAADLKVTIPPVPLHTVKAMNEIAERPVLNPLDAGGYYDAKGRYSRAVGAAVADPEVDTAIACVAYCPAEGERNELFEAATALAPTSEKPLIIFSFSSGPISASARARLRAAGLYPLKGCREALLALKRWQWWNERQRRATVVPAAFAAERAAALSLPAGAGNIDPGIARGLLLEAGLSLPPSQKVWSADEALAAAMRLGLPIVMKVEHADLLHKTEIGGVVTGLDRPKQIASAYQRLVSEVIPRSGLNGAAIVVQKQVDKGIELLLAIRRDPVFGPYVVAGLGGTNAELFRDVAVRLAPVSIDEARAMLAELRGYALLEGYRNGRRYDVGAAAEAIRRVSDLTVSLGERLHTLEMNPLIVLPGTRGSWVVDVTLTLT